MIEVVAPATLSEGYKFDAQIGDRTFQVTVPPGGIEGGQRFTVPMPSSENGFDNTIMMVPKINVPVGHWKDGICDCLTYGPCHNHCLMACFCPLRKLLLLYCLVMLMFAYVLACFKYLAAAYIVVLPCC